MKTYQASIRAKDLAVKMAEDGQATATVSGYFTLFGVPNLVGTTIAPTAFDASLTKWQESGDPIPFLFSHDWGLTGFLGSADANDVVADEHGMSFKATIDTSTEAGAKTADLIARRLIREMSFSADIQGEDGDTLTQLDLIEFGPTLKGLMPGTDVIAAALAKYAGRRNAKLDMQRLQAIHSALLELGVTCEAPADEESEDEAEAVEPAEGNPAGEDLLLVAENAWLDAKLFSYNRHVKEHDNA